MSSFGNIFNEESRVNISKLSGGNDVIEIQHVRLIIAAQKERKIASSKSKNWTFEGVYLYTSLECLASLKLPYVILMIVENVIYVS